FRGPWSTVSVNQDLTMLAEPLRDGRVKLLNTHTRESNFLKVSEHPVGYVSLSPSGRALVTGGFAQATQFWDLDTGKSFTLGRDIRRAIFSPDSKLLAAFPEHGPAQILDAKAGSLLTELNSTNSLGFAVAFSPDSRYLAISDGPVDVENSIGIWE